MQTGRAGQTSRAGWAGRTGREILCLLFGNELNCPPISAHPSSASLAHFLQTVLPSQRFLRMPLFYESTLERMVGRQLCNKASWIEKTADVSCYSHYLKNIFFLLSTVIFLASTLLFSGISCVLAWAGPFHSATLTLRSSLACSPSGIIPHTVWLSFTYSATVCDSADNYLSAMAGVHNLLYSVHTQVRHLPKSSGTTWQGSSVVEEVLWLVQHMRAGVKSEQIFHNGPFWSISRLENGFH